MNKTYIALIGVFIISSIVLSVYFYSDKDTGIQTQQVLTFGTQQNQITLAELYEQLGDNHTIDGNSVFIDDSNLYMSATPHTLKSSGEVTFNLVSKVYEGSADIIFGFDYPTTKPTTAEYYNPTVVTTEQSYTCSEPYWYSYTLEPKVFNCWLNKTSNSTGQITSELIFTHAFDRADIPTRTAYWNVYTNKDWHDISGSFQSVDYSYGGMTKWYYKTFDVIKDQEYTMKANIDIPFKNVGARKYWVCIKPSDESISQAVANDHLYCLDPWYDATYPYRYDIEENTTNSMALAVNDTDGVNGDIIWAKIWDESYVYSTGLGPSGTMVIANETDQKFWENETSLLGNTPTSVWDSSTVAVWHMGESAGNAMDSTSNNNDATAMVDIGYSADGVFGYGYDFDGDDLVTIGDSASLDIVGDLVIAGWINPDTIAGEDYIIHKDQAGAGYYLELNAGQMRLLIRNGAGSMYRTSTGVIGTGTWTHFVAVYDASVPSIKIYMNGTEVAGTTTGSQNTIVANALPLKIGSDQTPANYFDGKMDELRIYNNADLWTDERVRNEYYNGFGNLTYVSDLVEIYSNILGITINSLNASTTIYEATSTYYNISLTSTNWMNLTGVVTWNNTNYVATMTNTSPTVWRGDGTLAPPLVNANPTAKTYIWNFTLTNATGTFYNLTTLSSGQNVYYSTYLGAPSASPASPIGGETVRLSSTLTKHSSVAVYNTSGTFDSDAYTLSGTYYFDITTPMVSTDTNYAYKFGMTVSYGGATLYRESTDGSLTVTPILILNNGTGIATVNFKYFKEESPYTPINATHNLAITVWKDDSSSNATFNFTLSENVNHTLSIYPVTADVYAFSIQEYENDGDEYDNNLTYPTRNYYMNGLHLTNVSQDINLYLLNSTYADVVGFSAVDKLGEGVSNLIVDAQRYYPGENLYRTVARGYTDSDGDAVMRLFKCTDEASVYHKFFVYQNYELIETYDQMCIIDDIVYLPISATGTGWWNTYGDVSGNCIYYNTTQLIVCEYSGSETYNAELYVVEVELSGYTEKCNTTLSATSGSLTCDLSGMTDEEYYYVFKLYDSDDTLFTVASDYIKNLGVGEYGLMGVFMTFMLIITLAFIGWQSPFIMILLSVVAIVAGVLMGMLELSTAGIMGIIVAGAILIYGVK